MFCLLSHKQRLGLALACEEEVERSFRCSLCKHASNMTKQHARVAGFYLNSLNLRAGSGAKKLVLYFVAHYILLVTLLLIST